MVDTSGLLAALDSGQTHHQEARRALESVKRPLLMTPFVLAELDYLLSKFAGPHAARLMLREVAIGAYKLVEFDNAAIAICYEMMESQQGMDLGIADTSVWFAAHRYGVQDILTLDQRHFRRLTGPNGKPFRLMPADAE